MQNAAPSSLLLAVPDKGERGEFTSALLTKGWSVEEASDLDGVRIGLGARPQFLLLAASLADGRLKEVLAELQAGSAAWPRIILALDSRMMPDLGACSELGVVDFVEWPLRPELLLHRLGSLADSGVSDPNEWMDPADFQALLEEELEVAGSNATKVCVISATLDPALTPDLDLITVELARRMQATLLDTDGLAPGTLPARARVCSSEPGLLHLVIPGVTRLQDTARIGARLRECLDRPVQLEGSNLSLQVGLGVAAYPEDGSEAESLVDRSAEAARRPRGENPSPMAYHTEAMGHWAFERLVIERSLREAISRDELRVHYQPRVDAQTRRIKGMECLVRWQHPELGLVPPAQFIPLAEETGLIVPIGEWVLREACRQNQAWREMGLPEVAVSVNLSPVQFGEEGLYDVVKDSLKQSGLTESGLELEVTESMLMNDPKKTVEILTRLKASGIHISIDDFGTGYSSLSYLKRFPIDALKIDRSFVMNVTTDPDDAAIATAIILMGHSLNLSVVAEGVETESQFEFLRLLQCNEIQGYLFSPPVPADQAEELLRDQAQRFQAA